MTRKNNENELPPYLNFSVDSQLLGEIGERLVTKKHIALSELVKNAYDADSPDVNITLFSTSSGSSINESKIIVEDHGSGMTFQQIRDYWMTIATSHKVKSNTSKKFGRPTTGNKGIGRFACQKLAKNLVLTSCAQISDNKGVSSFEHTRVVFNWDDFVPSTKITEIPCQYETKRENKGRPGVTLELVELREQWSQNDFNMLQKNIALVSVAKDEKREGYLADPGFRTTIQATEFDKSTISLDEKILQAGWGTVEGKVDSDGILKIDLNCKGFADLPSYEIAAFKGLEDLEFRIHIIPQSSQYRYVDNRRDPKLLTKSIITDIWKNASGIRLYVNGFRTYPYGDIDAGDDWLQIAKDIGIRRSSPDRMFTSVADGIGVRFSRSMLNHPGIRSHIGAVHIKGRCKEKFEIKMDREGLLENGAFLDLRRALRLSLDYAALHYEAFIKNEVSKRERESAKAFRETLSKDSFDSDPASLAKEAFKVIETSFSTLLEQTEDIKLVQQSRESFTKATDFISKAQDEAQRELDTLRSISATAPLLFVFAHEFKGILSSLTFYSDRLEQLASGFKDEKIAEELDNFSRQIKEDSVYYQDITNLFDVFSDSKKHTEQKTSFYSALNSIQKGLGYLLNEFDISISLRKVKPSILSNKLNRAEVYSILINSISNSIKALVASSPPREIAISTFMSSDKICLKIQDNGIGLKQEYWESVFNPFISDPSGVIYSSLITKLQDEQLTTLGKGSGLGLHIIKNIVGKHRGKAYFAEPDKGYSTNLVIEI
ncbi:MAG: hypothetical protein C9356_09205 [Oleiphilus sp.]|nr:MAG: hypothetical protein C9356_09205 [Oleiphilus sp.]